MFHRLLGVPKTDWLNFHSNQMNQIDGTKTLRWGIRNATPTRVICNVILRTILLVTGSSVQSNALGLEVYLTQLSLGMRHVSGCPGIWIWMSNVTRVICNGDDRSSGHKWQIPTDIRHRHWQTSATPCGRFYSVPELVAEEIVWAEDLQHPRLGETPETQQERIFGCSSRVENC